MVKKINYDTAFEFVEEVLSTFLSGDSEDISIYVDTEKAVWIVRELIGQDYVDTDSLAIECMDIDPFEHEVTLITIDSDGGIWVENAMGRNSFKVVESSIVYVESQYYKEALDANDDDDIEYKVFSIGEDESDNKKVMIATDEEGRIGGFRYEDNDDGHCFKVEYCSCVPVEDVPRMLEICNNILNEYEKMFWD